MLTPSLILALAILLSLVLLGGSFFSARLIRRRIIAEAEKRSRQMIAQAEKKIEEWREKAYQEGKERFRRERHEWETRIQEESKELRELRARLHEREGELTRRLIRIENQEEELRKRAQALKEREEAIASREKEVEARYAEVEEKLSEIAGWTVERAREEILKRAEEKARLESARIFKRITEEARNNAEEEAKKIIALAVQRYVGEYAGERSITVVTLPDEQMKGRIIGKEGRNIRTFELITGVDLIVDDTPECVVISSHNPLRRHIARLTLERLIQDGRIQPSRIEEVYQAVAQETEKAIQEAGEQAVFDLGLEGMHPELIRLMGILQFRSSYAQNLLLHSLEVAYLCGIMADELGLNRMIARRAGFLHDVGKAVDHEYEGSHADIGAELCEKYGEPEEIIRAVREHHNNPPSTIYGILVQSADTLSAARPGARREQLAHHIKRMEELEELASHHPGVQKAYVLQSGREVRIILESEKTSDETAYLLAQEVADEISRKIAFPGEIKVTVIRETRAIAYAR
jgi:ribonuclease Y